MSDSLQSHGLYSSWNSPGQNTGVGSLSLLQGIFPTQRSNPGLPHYRRILYQLRHKGSPSLHQMDKLLELQISISPFSGYLGLISFRIDWFDLAAQGTLKSLLQHHNSNASVLQCSAFFRVQFSHPYMITGKTIALTIGTFVGKVSAF